MNATLKFRQSSKKDEMRLRPGRAAVVFIFLGMMFGVLVLRAFYLQWGDKVAFLQNMSETRVEGIVEIPATRGMITDRNGKELAISLPVKSLLAHPNLLEISDKNISMVAQGLSVKQETASSGGIIATAHASVNTGEEFRQRVKEEVKKLEDKRQALAKLLGISTRELRQRINQEKNVVYIAKRLRPEVADAALDLKIRGLATERGYWRYYPSGNLTAQVIGFTGDGDKGQEGMELAMQDQLKSLPGSRRVIRNVKREAIDAVGEVTLPQNGENVTLSLDLRLQELAMMSLRDAVREHKAKAGSVVVLDATTGEVLAMVSLPSYDPNYLQERNRAGKRNRAVVDQFEPGSTFKPFTAALALNQGLVNAKTKVEIGDGRLRIGKFTISDAHHEDKSWLTVQEVLQRSSNVGSAQLAFKMTPAEMWQGLTDMGFGLPTGARFPGETAGKLLSPKQWGRVEQATISYGHGVTVSLLQLARAYTIFVNGDLKPVSLVKTDRTVYGKRVISPETAAMMRHFLEAVTEKGGTGWRAQVPGYRVAGKTGTARKAENGGYSLKKYVSSFVGFAPVQNPRLIVAVMIDEPSGKQYYGAQVAAPVFANIVGKALHQLNVPPDSPITSFKMPEGMVDFAEET